LRRNRRDDHVAIAFSPPGGASDTEPCCDVSRCVFGIVTCEEVELSVEEDVVGAQKGLHTKEIAFKSRSLARRTRKSDSGSLLSRE
jgi:hypothetical protein